MIEEGGRTLFLAEFTTHFNLFTAWNVSKYIVLSGLYFPVFGPDKILYFDTFHAVVAMPFLSTYGFLWKKYPPHFIGHPLGLRKY